MKEKARLTITLASMFAFQLVIDPNDHFALFYYKKNAIRTTNFCTKRKTTWISTASGPVETQEIITEEIHETLQPECEI